MTNEEQLVSNYEYNRRDKLRSVIADYLSDAGVTAQFIVDEIKEELNGQLEYYRCKTDKISEAVELFATHHDGTYPVTITPDEPSLSYATVGSGNTAAYPTSTYCVDGHGDVHVSIADTTAEVFNIDTELHGEVSVASSDTGYYDHDLAGAYYVPPTVDYTNPNPDVATEPMTFNTGSNVAVASSESDPAGNYGAGGVSPEEQKGGSRPQYGQHGNFQDNFPPRS